MDVNDLRIAVTLISLLLFLALVAHTWSRRRTADHADAALLPFMGGEEVAAPEQANPAVVQGPHQGEKA